MKKLIAILAFIGILIQSLNQVVIVAEYYVNKDFIAKNLCENRNKPRMHCEGKCCLKKKLAKEGKEQAPSPRNQKDQVVNLFHSDTKIQLTAVQASAASEKYFNYNELRTCAFHHSVFHPPAA